MGKQTFAEAEIGTWIGQKSWSITGTYSRIDLRTAAHGNGKWAGFTVGKPEFEQKKAMDSQPPVL